MHTTGIGLLIWSLLNGALVSPARAAGGDEFRPAPWSMGHAHLRQSAVVAQARPEVVEQVPVEEAVEPADSPAADAARGDVEAEAPAAQPAPSDVEPPSADRPGAVDQPPVAP